MNRTVVDHTAAANYVVVDHVDLFCRGERAGIDLLRGEAHFRGEVDTELSSISFVTRVRYDPPIVSSSGVRGLV